MGFMGLEHFNLSDKAYGAFSNMINALAESLEKSFGEQTNEYNTDGPVNVAMIFRDIICQQPEDLFPFFQMNQKLQEIARKTLDAIRTRESETEAQDWSEMRRGEEGKRDFLFQYAKMIKALTLFLPQEKKESSEGIPLWFPNIALLQCTKIKSNGNRAKSPIGFIIESEITRQKKSE